ncbi:LuxR C-terminal-related transcriptional regulator [Williamsia muralis]|uniref:LuxR C-terminal-related transcriptional regulator n=1 Tax=Williamsia marianensis TaxID=85044 RepID=A0ABU4EVL0_WILMA|nr:LuxR C-terminal-related transcriptional regulator [Williamsia muralis]MDV7135280.1 LuxR C-terminal-related transcriptional regulator [Williamsia muralis]
MTLPRNHFGNPGRPRAGYRPTREEALARLRQRQMPLPDRAVAAQAMPAAPTYPSPGLSDREVQVLRAWLALDSKSSVAQRLCISLGTVNTHLTRIRVKYRDVGRSAPTKAALVARAIQDGIVLIDDL